MRVCMLQVSNVGQCREVRGTEVSLSCLTQSSLNPKHTSSQLHWVDLYLLSHLLPPSLFSFCLSSFPSYSSVTYLCQHQPLIKFGTLWLNTGFTLWCSHCFSDWIWQLLLLSRSPHICFQFSDAPGVATRMTDVGKLLVRWKLSEHQIYSVSFI